MKKRGEVWEIDFRQYQTGSEIDKIRRGVIVQADIFPSNRRTHVAVPLTTKLHRKGLGCPAILATESQTITADVVALTPQIRAIDDALFLSFYGSFSSAIMQRIDEALLQTLNISAAAMTRAVIVIPKRPK